jgi:hypothetical protein
VKPELVNKLPTKMRRFHDWYLKKSAGGLEMFGMLVRPEDFALQNEKIVWLRFSDIYEIYHLDTMNTVDTVNSCIKERLELQAENSPVVVKGPFFPRVVNPRYRIHGTMCNARIQSSKARKAIL